jgi:hypothetical protein
MNVALQRHQTGGVHRLDNPVLCSGNFAGQRAQEAAGGKLA